jgi:hypothetical protein
MVYCWPDRKIMETEQDIFELTVDIHEGQRSLLTWRYDTTHGKTPHCWAGGTILHMGEHRTVELPALLKLRCNSLCRTTPHCWAGGTILHMGEHRTVELSCDYGAKRHWWAAVWQWDNKALSSLRYDKVCRKVPHSCSMFLCSFSDWSDFDITVLWHFSSISSSDYTESYITCTDVYSLLYVFEWNVFRQVTRKAQNQGIWESGTEENLLPRL